MDGVREATAAGATLGAGGPGDPVAGPPADRRGTVRELLSGRVANAVALAIALLSVVGVFVFIHRYALNIVYFDQWKDVRLVHRALHGSLTFNDLWAQHNENRILVPNLIVVAIGVTTHLQVLVEEYLSGVVMCVTAALIVLAHRRRSPTMPWIAYSPVVVVWLSSAVARDALFGFDLGWFLVLAALAASVFLADKVDLGRLALAGAVLAAVAGSYSSLQGLLIWPAVLVLLWIRKRSLAVLGVWIGAAAVTTALFFVNFDFSQAPTAGPTSASGVGGVLSFAVAEAGNVLGGQATHATLEWFGALILALAATALVVGVRRGSDDGAATGVVLVVFGLLFIATTTIGRIGLGLAAAQRYAPFVLMVWVGAYLTLASWALRPRPVVAVDGGPPGRTVRNARLRVGFGMVLLAAAAAVLGMQFLVSRGLSDADAAAWHRQELTVANVTANAAAAPDGLIGEDLSDYPVPVTRTFIGYAREDHLSLFNTGLAAAEVRRGLDQHQLTQMVRPYAGQTVAGRVGLEAGVAAGLAAVTFQLRDGAHGAHDVAVATLSGYGYVATWDSTSVPNGWHYLRSRAVLPDGSVVESDWLGVLVAN